MVHVSIVAPVTVNGSNTRQVPGPDVVGTAFLVTVGAVYFVETSFPPADIGSLQTVPTQSCGLDARV
ncbi:hypothetical protein D3C87_1727590 [compost metagenome]